MTDTSEDVIRKFLPRAVADAIVAQSAGSGGGAVVQVGKLIGASFDASQGSDQEIILSSGTGKPFIVEMIIAANFSGQTSESYFYFYTGPLGTGYAYSNGYLGYTYGGTEGAQVMSSIAEGQDDNPISMPALADGDTLYANQAGTPEAITVDLYVYGRLLGVIMKPTKAASGWIFIGLLALAALLAGLSLVLHIG